MVENKFAVKIAGYMPGYLTRFLEVLKLWYKS